MRTILFVACLMLSPLAARADAAAVPQNAAEASTFAVNPKDSSVTYRLVHKLHKFDGVSKQVEGRARIGPDGKVQVMVRVPVESFDSRNANRDAHMKEVVEAARFPSVELKAVGQVAMPTSYPAKLEGSFEAELSFHGVKKRLPLPVQLTFKSATDIVASVGFSFSLTEMKIERPSLMFVKIDDMAQIQAEVWFTRPM